MTEKPIGHCTLEQLAVLAHVVPGEARIPIYIAPPKREWVGLTHEQTKDCLKAWDENDAYALCRAIEAKLKEKNSD